MSINRGGILEPAAPTSSQPLMLRAGQALTLNGGILRLRKSYTDTTTRTFSNPITLTTAFSNTIESGAESFIEHRLVGPANTPAACALTACDRTTTLSGNMVLGHTLGIRTEKTGNLTGNYNSKVRLSGNISGAGGLVKEGAGDLRLSGASTYTGPTTINGGSLTLGITNAISIASRLFINNGATLNMGNFNQTLKGLRLNNGNITANARLGDTTATRLGATASGVLTMTARDVDEEEDPAEGLGEFDVRKGRIEAILRGQNIDLIKRSDSTTTGDDIGGTVRLSFGFAHPFTGGDVTIEAGRLIIDGTLVGGTLSVRGTYDLKGVNRVWANVTLISGHIMDSGRIVGSRTLVKGALTVTGTLNLQSGLVSARLSGMGALVKNQVNDTTPGKVTLSNAGNDYTGDITINKGTLAITHAGALGRGTNPITVNSGGALALEPATGRNLTLTRALNLVGGALASLRGNNTWSGNLTLTANNSVIRSAAGSTLTVSRGLSLQTTGGTPAPLNLKIKGMGNVVLSGVISGLGGLIKGDPAAGDTGRLTLTGDNTFAGAVTVNHGVLRVEHNNALGAAPESAASTTTLNDGATLDLAGGAGNLSIANTESLTLSGAGAASVPAEAKLRNISGNNTVNGNILLRNDVAIHAAFNTTLTLAGVISGVVLTSPPSAAGLFKTGAGKLVFTGSNTYQGETRIDEGELELRNGAALHDSSAVTLGAVSNISTPEPSVNAKLIITDSETIGSLRGGGQGGGNTEIKSGQTLTVNQTRASQYDGRIRGAGNFKKSGARKLMLAGANDYSGTTEVDAGTLAITRSSGLGTAAGGTTVNAGATLELAAAGLNVADALTLSGTLDNAGGDNEYSGNITLAGTGALDSAADTTLTVSGNIGDTGNLNKTGAGVVALTGDNDYAGATRVTAGILRIAHQNALGTPPSSISNGNTTVVNGATLELDSASGNLTITEALSLAGRGVNTAAEGEPAVYLGALRNVSGNNTVSGTITLADAATIHNAAPGGNSLTLAGISGAGHNLTITGAGNTTINGIIAIGAGRLSKAGTGRLRLTGVNSYTGDTHINDGELELDNATGNVIAQSANVILATTGSPKLSITRDQTIASLRGGGEVAIAASRRLTVDQAGNTSYSGVISGTGAGGLSKDGTGTLTLGGANTYGGTTEVNAGKLAITHDTALGATGDGNGTTVASGATLELRGRTSFDASGTLNGYSNITVAENLTLNGGTLRNLHGFNILSGTMTLGADSLIDSHRDEDTVVGTIDPGTADCPAGGAACESKGLPGRLSLSGVISSGNNNYGLTKIGLNNLVLSGANTYGGETIVARGALTASNNSALGATGANAGTIVYNNASLVLQGNIAIGNEALTLAGGSLNSGTGDNSWAGDIALDFARDRNSAGTVTTGTTSITGHIRALLGNLSLTGAISLRSGEGAVARAHTLEIFTTPAFGRTPASAVTLSGDISGAGGNLIKLGGGKLTLSGTNSYTGLTQIGRAATTSPAAPAVSGGELELQGGNAIANGGAIALANVANTRLTVSNSETIGSLQGGGEVAIASGQRLTVNQSGNTSYNGLISGAGGLTKDGAGTLTLTGANTYGGTTLINNGTLAITRAGALGNTSGVTVNSGGTLALNPAAGSDLSLSRALTLAGGALASLRGNNTWSGALTLTDHSVIRSAAGALDVSGDLSLQTTGETPAARNLTIKGAGDVLLLGRISGLGGLIKGAADADTGLLRLTRNNTFAGDVEVNHGVLRVEHNSALGSTAGDTTVAAGATLQLAGDGLNVGEALTLAGGALGNLRGNNTWSGNLTFTADSVIQSAAGALTVRGSLRLETPAVGDAAARAHGLTVKGAGDVILSGRISGAGGLIKGTAVTDTGRLTLSGINPNTYAGATAVNHGVLRIRKAGALGAATSAGTDDTTVAAGATLELDPETGNLTIDANEGLSLAGQGALSASARLGALRNTRGDNTISGNIALTGNATLHVGAGATLTVTGAIGHAAGAAAGASFGLSKTGAGRLTLNGQNTYTGVTNIKQGALAIGRSNGINRASRLVVGQLRSGATAAVPGEFILGAYNQTFSGVQLNAGAITASPRAPTTAGNASTGQGVLTVTPRRATARTTANQGVGEFDLRAGEIQAILNGPADIIKDSDGTTRADQTPTRNAEDIGGVVTLTYTGDHLYTGSVSILAGRLVVRGNLPSSILIVQGGVHDLRGRPESYRGVRLISGSIIDSGRAGEDGARVKGSLTVDRDTRSGGSYGEFDLRSGTVSATLAGSGALVKRTAGLVTLSGNNTYSGQTTVEAGILRITHANALGTPAPVDGVTPTTNTTVRSGATLQLAGGTGGINFSNRETLTLSGQGVVGNIFTYGRASRLGALHNLSGNNTWNGAINLGAAAKINAQAAFVLQRFLPPEQVYTLRLTGQIDNRGRNLTLSTFAGINERSIQSEAKRRALSNIEVSPAGEGPAITGAGGLIKAGGGPRCATVAECATADAFQNSRVTLAGPNDYRGQTTINAGELRLTHAEALPGALNLGRQDGAQLVVAANATIGSLSGGASSTASGNALNNGRIIILKGYTLSINQTTAGTYGSRIIERDPDPVPNPAPGGANLVKTGAARLTLTGDSAYTGTTTVSGGALNIRQPNALGPTTGGEVRVNGGTLELQFNTGARTFGKNLRLAGPGARSNPADPESARLGALRSIRGTNTLSGRITLTNDATIHNANAGTATA